MTRTAKRRDLPADSEELSWEGTFREAREPKELRLFQGARHGLDDAREEILELLVEWLQGKLR